MMGDGMSDGGMMGGMWLVGLFGLLVIAGGLVLVLWAILRSSSSGGAPGGKDDRSLAILRERFARGELTESEFEEQRRVLEQTEK